MGNTVGLNLQPVSDQTPGILNRITAPNKVLMTSSDGKSIQQVDPTTIIGSGGTIPAPALVATSNIALTGIVTVDGVSSNSVSGDVLCVAQSDNTKNGYWTPNAAGAWLRPSYYSTDAHVLAVLGLASGAVLGGLLGIDSVWYQKTGTTVAGAKSFVPQKSGKVAPVRAVQTLLLTTSGTVFGTPWTYSAGVWTAPVNGVLASPWISFDNIVTPAIGDRLLISQPGAADLRNGIFVITSIGSVSTPATLSRSTDFGASTDLSTGIAFEILDGDKFGGTRQQLLTRGGIVIGTTPLQFGAVLTPSVNYVDLSAPPYNIKAYKNNDDWLADGTDYFRAIDAFAYEHRNDPPTQLTVGRLPAGLIRGLEPFDMYGNVALLGSGKLTTQLTYSFAGGHACVTQVLEPTGDLTLDGFPAIGPTVDAETNATSLSMYQSARGLVTARYFYNLNHAGVLLDDWSQFQFETLIRFNTLGSVLPSSHIISCRGRRTGSDADDIGPGAFGGCPFSLIVAEGTSPIKITAQMRLTDITAGVYGATVHTGSGIGTIVGDVTIKPTEDAPNFTVRILHAGTAGIAGITFQWAVDGQRYCAEVALGTATSFVLSNEVNEFEQPFTAKINFSGVFVAGDTYKIPCSGVNQNVSLTSSTALAINTNYHVCLQYFSGHMYLHVSPVGGALDSGASAVTGVACTGVVRQRNWETTIFGWPQNASAAESLADFGGFDGWLGSMRFKNSNVTALSAVPTTLSDGGAIGAGGAGQKFCWVPRSDLVRKDAGGVLRRRYRATTEPGREVSWIVPRSPNTGAQFANGGFENLAFVKGTDASQRASSVLAMGWRSRVIRNCSLDFHGIGPDFGSSFHDIDWTSSQGKLGPAFVFFQGIASFFGQHNFSNIQSRYFLLVSAAAFTSDGAIFLNMDTQPAGFRFDNLQGGHMYLICDAENMLLNPCGREIVRASVATGYSFEIDGSIFTAETLGAVTQVGGGANGRIKIGNLNVTVAGPVFNPGGMGGLVVVNGTIPFSSLRSAPPFIKADLCQVIMNSTFITPLCDLPDKIEVFGMSSVVSLATGDSTLNWSRGQVQKLAAGTLASNSTKTLSPVGMLDGDQFTLAIEPQGFTTTVANGGPGGTTAQANIVLPVGFIGSLTYRKNGLGDLIFVS